MRTGALWVWVSYVSWPRSNFYCNANNRSWAEKQTQHMSRKRLMSNPVLAHDITGLSGCKLRSAMVRRCVASRFEFGFERLAHKDRGAHRMGIVATLAPVWDQHISSRHCIWRWTLGCSACHARSMRSIAGSSGKRHPGSDGSP